MLIVVKVIFSFPSSCLISILFALFHKYPAAFHHHHWPDLGLSHSFIQNNGICPPPLPASTLSLLVLPLCPSAVTLTHNSDI